MRYESSAEFAGVVYSLYSEMVKSISECPPLGSYSVSTLKRIGPTQPVAFCLHMSRIYIEKEYLLNLKLHCCITINYFTALYPFNIWEFNAGSNIPMPTMWSRLQFWNIWVQCMVIDFNNSCQGHHSYFPVLYGSWTSPNPMLQFEDRLPAGTLALSFALRCERTKQLVLHSLA